MFLKKSLLFMTALALLMFAGQASAQGVSLTHVPVKVAPQVWLRERTRLSLSWP